MQRAGSRIRSAASSQASSAKSSALILYRRQLKADASIGLRIARLQLLWRPTRAMRGNEMRRARSVARKATEVSLEDEIARLRGLDIEALRARWRTVFGGKAPPHLPRHLLFAIIAYRLQAEVLGDLDAETLRLLKKINLAPSKTRSRSFNRGIGAAAARTLTGNHPHARMEWANTPGDGGGTRICLGRHHL